MHSENLREAFGDIESAQKMRRAMQLGKSKELAALLRQIDILTPIEAQQKLQGIAGMEDPKAPVIIRQGEVDVEAFCLIVETSTTIDNNLREIALNNAENLSSKVRGEIMTTIIQAEMNVEDLSDIFVAAMQLAASTFKDDGSA